MSFKCYSVKTVLLELDCTTRKTSPATYKMLPTPLFCTDEVTKERGLREKIKGKTLSSTDRNKNEVKKEFIIGLSIDFLALF